MEPRSDIRIRAAVASAALTMLAAVLVAGCGGDGGETTPTADATTDLPTGALSKSELATEADALCTDMSDRILEQADPPDFGEDGPQPDEVKASAPYWEATVSEAQTLLDQLSQLQPPESEQKQWDEFLKLLETSTVDYANALLAPAEAGDPDAFYQAAVDSQKNLLELNRASQQLGLEVCGARDTPS